MKKTIITLTILFGMSMGLSAQGGMFGYGETRSSDYRDEDNQSLLHLPSSHGGTEDDGAPLGSGIAVLVGLGAAYALTKKRNN